MLTEKQIELINTSFEKVGANRPELIEMFYTRLFCLEPGLREEFEAKYRNQTLSIDSLLQMALLATQNPSAVASVLRDIGVKNAKLGQSSSHYPIINEILIDTLAAEAGDVWTPEVSIAWSTLLGFVSQTMVEGAESVEAGEPLMFGT